MRNCLILGCGRSGTSMLAGTLAAAGYYMGSALYRGREANPKGFFESAAINAINEKLLAPHAPPRSRWWWMRVWRGLFPSERWLAQVAHEVEIKATPKLAAKISRQIARAPFAFKDPRFCYTLPAWRPLLPEATVYLCIFREPGRTVESMLAECRHKYPDISLTPEDAFDVWTTMYAHVLKARREGGDWLFVHFDQVLDGSAMSRIEKHLETRVDRNFPEAKLRRSPPREAPQTAQTLYRELCALADHTP